MRDKKFKVITNSVYGIDPVASLNAYLNSEINSTIEYTNYLVNNVIDLTIEYTNSIAGECTTTETYDYPIYKGIKFPDFWENDVITNRKKKIENLYK